MERARSDSVQGAMPRLVAECLGTFTLVFAGTGAIAIDEITCGSVSHVGSALILHPPSHPHRAEISWHNLSYNKEAPCRLMRGERSKRGW